jgi:hypothetical protein
MQIFSGTVMKSITLTPAANCVNSINAAEVNICPASLHSAMITKQFTAAGFLSQSSLSVTLVSCVHTVRFICIEMYAKKLASQSPTASFHRPL